MVARPLIVAPLCCLLFMSSAVYGAPFCIEAQGLPAECWYYDVRSCRVEAAKRDGYCGVNLDEVALTKEGAAYCLVEYGTMPVCAYLNAESCEAEAGKRNAVCAQNSDQASLDPYFYDRMPFQGE